MTAGGHGSDVREVLRDHGLRSTSQRLAILHLLAEADPHQDAATHGHLAVNEIHRRLLLEGHALDLTTVYRTLTTLAELGVVHVLPDAAGAMSYGLAVRAHHHAVCTRCGAVTAIAADQLAGALDAAERTTGFRAADATITVHGTCADCRG